MRSLPAATVVTRAEMRAAGWSDAAVTRAVRAGRLLRLRRGVFTAVAADADVAAHLRAVAAARVCGGSVVSHRSAALLHGLALLKPPGPLPDLTVRPGGTSDTAGAHLFRAALPDAHVMPIHGVRITTPARTAVDVARLLSVGAGVVTFDSVLNQGKATRADLAAVIAGCAGWAGIGRAARALELADAAAESALESVSRLVFRRLELPAPSSQARIYRLDGTFVARTDFYWDDVGVVGEADGRQKYTDRDVLVAEKRRQEALEDLGLVVVRWGWSDVRYDQGELRRRILAAFDRGRARDAAALSRSWSVRDR